MTSVTGDAHASSATFDLTAKWIVSRLADEGFGRLEAAAEFLRNIPNTGEKIDIEKAKERGWKTDFKVAFSDIGEHSPDAPGRVA